MIEKSTERGFPYLTFKDRYDNLCSIQESSMVEPCLWLGIENPDLRIMCSDAKKLGLEPEDDCGWQFYPIPEEVSISNRMHLNIKQVKELVEKLNLWLETSCLHQEVEF